MVTFVNEFGMEQFDGFLSYMLTCKVCRSKCFVDIECRPAFQDCMFIFFQLLLSAGVTTLSELAERFATFMSDAQLGLEPADVGLLDCSTNH